MTAKDVLGERFDNLIDEVKRIKNFGNKSFHLSIDEAAQLTSAGRLPFADMMRDIIMTL